VPVAEFLDEAELERSDALRNLGPDLLSTDFVAADAIARLQARGDMEIADALLDQSAIAGIGNVYKSEVLFAGRVSPFARVHALPRRDLERLVAIAVRLLRANVSETSAGMATYGGLRRTTGRSDPGARFWVYGRAGKPCRRCGTAISRSRQGADARSTYWCANCQSVSRTDADSGT
jgi:endonuclease-8